ncbi:MAG: DUF6687 family protein [Candidatus Margulisiibacteriota bacterium]
MKIARPGRGEFRPAQQIGLRSNYVLTSPLTPGEKLVGTIKDLLDAGVKRVLTVDFALGKFYKSKLLDAGIHPVAVDRLLADNLGDPFALSDGNNPAKTATEITLAKMAGESRLLSALMKKQGVVVLTNKYIVVDNVCATFALLNPKMARAHQDILEQAARFGRYCDKVSDRAMMVSYTIEEMMSGSNKFGKPHYTLSDGKKRALFNEILKAMPAMLTNIERFGHLYEKRLNEHKTIAGKRTEGLKDMFLSSEEFRPY